MNWKGPAIGVLVVGVIMALFVMITSAPGSPASTAKEISYSPAPAAIVKETVLITRIIVWSPTPAPALSTAAAANAQRAVNDARVAEAQRLAAESDLALRRQAATATVAYYLAEQTRTYAQQTIDLQLAQMETTVVVANATVTAEFQRVAVSAEETRVASDLVRSEKRADTWTLAVVILIWVVIIGFLGLMIITAFKIVQISDGDRKIAIAVGALSGQLGSVLEILFGETVDAPEKVYEIGPPRVREVYAAHEPQRQTATLDEILELLNAALSIKEPSLAQNKVASCERWTHGSGWWRRVIQQMEADGQVTQENGAYIPKPRPGESFRSIGDVLRYYGQEYNPYPRSPPAPAVEGEWDF